MRIEEIWNKVKKYTLTDYDRVKAMDKLIEESVRNNIVGDFVECGVWKGGSAMAAAYSYLYCKEKYGIELPNLYLYDTYEGMTPPCKFDINKFNGRQSLKEGDSKILLEEVKSNMEITGYPKEKIYYIKGDVMETLRKFVPQTISILRLDTDFYESTKYELEMMYNNVSKGGYIIIDDYLHWKGSEMAVNEFIYENKLFVTLIEINKRDAVYWEK